MANQGKNRKRWKVSWDIRSERNGTVHLLYRTKFFRVDEEHLAINFANKKRAESGIQNVKIKEVNG
jgi:hypothetical protein